MTSVPDRQQRILKLVERNLRATIDGGMTRLRIENDFYDGVHIELEGRELVNFGSCAYSGLDTDPRTKAGAIEAVQRYGPVYSSSTIFASVPLYDELEDLLSRMLGANVIAMATTTLAHVAFFLVGFKPTDAILAVSGQNGLYSIDDVFRSLAAEISEFSGLTLAAIGDAGIPFIQTGETIPLLQREAERKAKGIIVG